MSKKTVELDDDLLAFALERCDADERVGMTAVRRASSIKSGKMFMDYVVKVKRLRAALEDAR